MQEKFMDKIDQAILRTMQNGIPILKEPFAEVAKKIRISHDEVIARLERMIKNGVVRRFGVSVNHRKMGIVANALVAWKVPQNRVEEVGKAMSNYSEITHCYERQTIPDKWEYNLFTVIHAYDRESGKQFIKGLAKAIGLKEYLLLFSVKQFKRTSVASLNQSHS
jgi:DNA-binding Lrp family transcriptional regulator